MVVDFGSQLGNGEDVAPLGYELHLPNNSLGEQLADVILQDEPVSWVGYCLEQNAIISKHSDLRLDVTGDVINVQEEEERSKDHALQNIIC